MLQNSQESRNAAGSGIDLMVLLPVLLAALSALVFLSLVLGRGKKKKGVDDNHVQK